MKSIISWILIIIINYVALQIKSLSKFGTEVWYKKQGRADIILIDDKTKLGMIIEMKYADSADDALTQTKKYIPIFEENKHFASI